MMSRRDAETQRNTTGIAFPKPNLSLNSLCDSASPRENLPNPDFRHLYAPLRESKMKDLNDISGQVVDASVQIHTRLAPGLLESVYERILAHELEQRGLVIQRQVPVPIVYDNLHFEEGFRADLIVEGSVIVELKSVETLAPVHSKQLLTYLKLLDYRLGLLINFGSPLLKDGIKRIVNNL